MTMPQTTYDYSISADTASGVVSLDSLEQAIRVSTIVTALGGSYTDAPSAPEPRLHIVFKDSLSPVDKTALDGLVAAHDGVALPSQQMTSDGRLKVALVEQDDLAAKVALVGRLGSEVIYATHNFCDPTTWYSESVRVTDEVLTDSGDGLTFDSAHANWIDMTHGAVMDEDAIAEEMAPSHKYAVTVTVDDVEKTQRAPFALSGGDYEVDYPLGKVTFFSAQSGVVKASYSYENGSAWIMRPTTGKQLKIEQAEAQFSDDIVMNDSIRFGAWGLVDVFAPQLIPGVPSGTLIPLQTTRYVRLDQIIDEALGSYPVIPAMGGATRGNLKPRYGFPFRYGAVRVLSSAAGMELRVRLESDIVYGGERATATFYCSSEDEG